MSRRRQQTVEPENCGPASGLSPAGLPRGRGDRTIGRRAAGQERPSLAALEWDARRDKAEPKRGRCQEGVRGGRSTEEARTNNLVEGRASA